MPFTTDMPTLLGALAFGYLLGSIPFGLVLTRLAGKGDVRAIGSGNIGATNVLRTGSKGLAAATLAGDALKGTLAVLVAAGLWSYEAGLAAGLGAFLGHIFPVWLKFRGGKGVATYLGVALGVYWPAALVFALAWFYCAALSRMSSFAGITAAIVTPVALWVAGETLAMQLFIVLAVLLLAKHHANIRRLLKGEEPRIGASRSGA